MSAVPGFVAELRARSDRALLLSDFKRVVIGLAIVLFGVVMANDIRTDGGSVAPGIIICAGAALWIAYVGLRALQRRNVAAHPLGKALAAFGDIEAVSKDIDADLAGTKLEDQPLHVGRRWLCYVWKRHAFVFPLEYVVWAYTERIKHSYNAIPYRVSYHLMLWGRDGKGRALPMRKRNTAASLQRLRIAAPWLPLGYSEKLKESWNADHAEFLAFVDARRRQAAP